MRNLDQDERQEQLDLVLKLNKLTKRRKLEWTRSTTRTLRGIHQYRAVWKGIQFQIENIATKGIARYRYAGANLAHRLRVQQPGETVENEIIIPPMPAIEDLVSTIRRVNDEPDRSQGGLSTLRSLNQQLDEEL